MQLRSLTPNDFPAVLALNADSVKVLSPLDAERLAWLHGMSAVRDVVEIDGEVSAFVLALREGTAYDSPNYRWFAERYPRFLYVDRIVVGAALRGRQVGAQLYAQATFCDSCAGDFQAPDRHPWEVVFNRGWQRWGEASARVNFEARIRSGDDA